MKKYRIAFFTVDWNYELVESTLHGLQKYVEDHENVYLRIFDCFGKDFDNLRSRSEYRIFELPDLSEFDGVLFQGNQIVLGSIREELSRRVLEAGIPAVSIDCPMPGCVMLGIDNRKAQYDITNHVIREHGARTLVYLTGIIGNGALEGEQRRDGFLEACRENGIPEENITVIPCRWRMSDGVDVARKWLEEGKPLPDAFISANDDMALGVMQVLHETGHSIPEEIIVTGFDNITGAELSTPRLSTVSRDYEAMNYYAMEILMNRIRGVENRVFIPFECEIIHSESCGCAEASRPEYIRNKYYHQTRFLKNFYAMQDQMAEELFETANMPELLEAVEKSHSIFGCDNFYLCINSSYYENFEKKQTRILNTYGSEMLLSACGHGEKKPDQEHIYERFPTRLLLPRSIAEKERFLIFYPLHYSTYSIGYLVLNDISEAAKMNLHESIFNFLEIAIENVRKKGILRLLNGVLDNLYVHDALTGLYNRFGYDRYAKKTMEEILAEKKHVQILFVDMDDMKGINDRFGHEVGDQAIRCTAEILQCCCDKKDFLMRYGGDEFLVIAPGDHGELEQAIRKAAAELSRRQDVTFDLSLSVGVIQADEKDTRPLEQLVQDADARMYERKKEHKGRG